MHGFLVFFFGYSDTKASDKISSVILNKYFCSNVKQLSPLHQTSICEAFLGVVNIFAPKSTAFTYNGMLARYGITVSMDIVKFYFICYNLVAGYTWVYKEMANYKYPTRS